jgi:GT2 family glycosyltransferase
VTLAAEDRGKLGSMRAAPARKIGIVIVTFNSSDVILECLETVLSSQGVYVRVVVVDNNSEDDTAQKLSAWASGRLPYQRPADSPLGPQPSIAKPVPMEERSLQDKPAPHATLTFIQTGINGGFAFGVNRGLEVLLQDPGIDDFWILNPDCAVPPDAAQKIMACAARGEYAMIGVRQLLYEDPRIIQSDAFRFNRVTGVCVSVNWGAAAAEAVRPDESSIDFVSGANMIVSRAFINQAGLMTEDYFLYYEEADWALRRGKLPVKLAENAIVYHHGGTSIGSGSALRRASAFSNYFNMRNRARFMKRHFPGRLLAVRLFVMAKALQLLPALAFEEAWGLIAGVFELAPPAKVRSRFKDANVRKLAFGTDG